MTTAPATVGPTVVDDDERTLAGKTSGLLYILGGVSLTLVMILPGVTHAHRDAVWGLAGIAVAWGVCQAALIDWSRAGWWAIHVSNVASLVLIAVTIDLTGGGRSPAWVYLFLVVVPAAYFYRPPVAVAYFAGCVAVTASVLVYDSAALHRYFLPQLVIAMPSYLALGVATLAGKRLLRLSRQRAEELAAEQGALRRVATAIAAGDSPDQLYELVAREAGALLGAGAAGIMRVDDVRHSTVMGAWADHPGGRYEARTVVPIRPGSDIEQAIATRQPVRIADHEPGSPVVALGYRCSIVAPIVVAGAVWGALAVTALSPDGFDVDDERRLTEFGNLLALAITSIEDRVKLLAQAASDGLTGLANHRTLREQLAAHTAQALGRGAPLSVAVIDIDYFKRVNDSSGHEGGDAALILVAQCLLGVARTEDTVARIGGDEFAWVLPDTTHDQALVAVQRARKAIAQAAAATTPLTVSAGICDTGAAEDPGDLFRRADRALYWSKQRGRDQAWVYDPIVADEFATS